MTAFNKVGIVGTGNMGGAIASGLAGSGDWPEENIYIYDIDEKKMDNIAGQFRLKPTTSVEKLAGKTDFIILAVKPAKTGEVLEKISDNCRYLISIAAGVKIEKLAGHLAADARIIRVMPNTPCQVGEGMSFIASSDNTGDKFLNIAVSVFENLGETEVIEESLMDAATALSGSGPAYVFYFLEALQEAGVYLGFDSEEALKTALQVVRGAVKIAGETKKSPAQLRQEVSSPGGTTVEALKYLDEQGTRGIIEEALRKACSRSEELGNSSKTGEE